MGSIKKKGSKNVDEMVIMMMKIVSIMMIVDDGNNVDEYGQDVDEYGKDVDEYVKHQQFTIYIIMLNLYTACAHNIAN